MRCVVLRNAASELCARGIPRAGTHIAAASNVSSIALAKEEALVPDLPGPGEYGHEVEEPGGSAFLRLEPTAVSPSNRWNPFAVLSLPLSSEALQRGSAPCVGRCARPAPVRFSHWRRFDYTCGPASNRLGEILDFTAQINVSGKIARLGLAGSKSTKTGCFEASRSVKNPIIAGKPLITTSGPS